MTELGAGLHGLARQGLPFYVPAPLGPVLSITSFISSSSTVGGSGVDGVMSETTVWLAEGLSEESG